MGRFFWIVMAVMAAGLAVLMASGDDGLLLGMDGDAAARALYLGVLGTVVGAGILGSGLRFGDVARKIAIWAVIILALMTGYQYRYELQDVGHRLSAGLLPGSPLSYTADDGRAAVMLDRLSSGHFEVRMSVDGVPVTAMVDTGASATVLTTADARRIGFDPDALPFTIPIMTANGPATAARVTAGEIRIGDITRRNLPVMIAAEGRLGQSLLGMNFIGTLSGFDMRGERLILRD